MFSTTVSTPNPDHENTDNKNLIAMMSEASKLFLLTPPAVNLGYEPFSRLRAERDT